jgi:hypothetical protein
VLENNNAEGFYALLGKQPAELKQFIIENLATSELIAPGNVNKSNTLKISNKEKGLSILIPQRNHTQTRTNGTNEGISECNYFCHIDTSYANRGPLYPINYCQIITNKGDSNVYPAQYTDPNSGWINNNPNMAWVLNAF